MTVLKLRIRVEYSKDILKCIQNVEYTFCNNYAPFSIFSSTFILAIFVNPSIEECACILENIHCDLSLELPLIGECHKD